MAKNGFNRAIELGFERIEQRIVVEGSRRKIWFPPVARDDRAIVGDFDQRGGGNALNPGEEGCRARMAPLERERDKLANVGARATNLRRNLRWMIAEMEAIAGSRHEQRPAAKGVASKDKAALCGRPPGKTELAFNSVDDWKAESNQRGEDDVSRAIRGIGACQPGKFSVIIETYFAGKSMLVALGHCAVQAATANFEARLTGRARRNGLVSTARTLPVRP